MPARGPVHLVKFYEEHAEATCLSQPGEAAEAAASDRMAGAKNIVPESAPMGLNPKVDAFEDLEDKVLLGQQIPSRRVLRRKSLPHQCACRGYHAYLRGEWNGKKMSARVHAELAQRRSARSSW